jgi:hypothetical protein
MGTARNGNVELAFDVAGSGHLPMVDRSRSAQDDKT